MSALLRVKSGSQAAEYIQVPRDKNAGIVVPADGKYIQLLPIWDVNPEWRIEDPIPAIANKSDYGIISKYNGVEYDYVTLPPVWQRFLWDLWGWSIDYSAEIGEIEEYYQEGHRLFAISTPRSHMFYYVNMIEAHRAWTDDRSVEGGAYDAVTGRNFGAKPYTWLARSCQLAVYKALKDEGSHWRVECLDVLKPPPKPSEIPFYLMHWALEVSTYPIRKYSPFPQAEIVTGIKNFSVPVPPLSLGGSMLIAKRSTRLLKAGEYVGS